MMGTYVAGFFVLIGMFQDGSALQALGKNGIDQEQGRGDDQGGAVATAKAHMPPQSTITSLRMLKLSRARPAPRTTVARGSSVILMGRPVSWCSRMSRFFSKATPPVR